MTDLDYEYTGKAIIEYCPICKAEVVGFITEIESLCYLVFQCSQCKKEISHKLYPKEVLEKYLGYL